MHAESSSFPGPDFAPLLGRALGGLLYDWDLGTNVVWRSPGLRDLLGLSPDEDPGGPDWWLERMHPDDRRIAEQRWAAAREGGQEQVDNDYRVRHKNGSWVRVWDKSLLVRDLHGRVVRVVGCTQPLSNLVRAELAHRASEERLALATHAAGVGLFQWDLERDMATWENEEMFRILGARVLRPSEFLAALPVPEEAEQLRRLLESAQTSGEAVHCEVRFRSEDGALRWLSLSGRPSRLDAGPARSLLGIVADTTERRATEEALRESEAEARAALSELESIYQYAPIGLCVLDPDLRFVRINRRLAEINGLPVAAHLGRRVADLLPELLEEASRQIRPVLETGTPVLDVELHGATPLAPGVPRVWRESFLPLRNSEGRVVGVNVVCEEITERKKAEEELAQAHAELLRANKRMNDFLATLSHELRTPLAALVCATQLLAGESDPGRRARALSVLERQLAQFQRLVDDLLDLSRVAQGKLLMRFEDLELGSLVERTRRTVELLEVGRRCRIVVDPPAPPIRVRGDSARLEQVLTNLLINACKYSPAGREIRVAWGFRENKAWLEVRDEGIGIPPELLERIFEPFAQVENAPWGAEGGLGIGLALVRDLVRLHGGTVEAHSEGPGHGSVFTVLLPSSTESPDAPGKLMEARVPAMVEEDHLAARGADRQP